MKISKDNKILSLTIVMSILFFSCNNTHNKPNIIIVLTDDQGWTDTSVRMIETRDDSKSDFYETPNLERLAEEGLVFSNAYAPAPVCTPTRYSILYGKTPAKLKHSTLKDWHAFIEVNKAYQSDVEGRVEAGRYEEWRQALDTACISIGSELAKELLARGERHFARDIYQAVLFLPEGVEHNPN